MPSWVAMAINQDELDLNPPGGNAYRPEPWRTAAELVNAHAKAVADARTALQKTHDEALMSSWRLLVAAQVESPRHVVIEDTFNHLSHHRGQLTVYLRLLGARVPAIFGPSADDKHF
jgi:uncharacterized damage-inducible protein DinB